MGFGKWNKVVFFKKKTFFGRRPTGHGEIPVVVVVIVVVGGNNFPKKAGWRGWVSHPILKS